MTNLADYFTIKESAEKIAIQKFIIQRRINSLYHFTHLENILSIQRHGLLDIKSLMEAGIPHRNSGARELLPVDGVFLSISQPNDYMRFHKRLTSGLPLVVLEIEGVESVSRILTSIPFIAVPGNSASPKLMKKLRENPSLFRGIEGLQNQYLNVEVRDRFALNSYETTDPQSEIIFLSRIPSNYISRWHIPEKYFNKAIEKFGDQDCFHKDYKISQGTWYDAKKAQDEKELRTWSPSWVQL